MSSFDDIQIDRVQFHVQGEPWSRWAAPRTVGAQPGERMKRIPEQDVSRKSALGLYTEAVYEDEKTGMRAVKHRQECAGSTISRHWTTVTNTSDTAVTLDVLHAAFVEKIGWDDPDSFRLHIPYNQNFAEAQWRACSLADMGIVKTTKPNVGNVMVNAVGRSAQVYVPMAILEDRHGGASLIWQVEHSGSWMWDLGQWVNGDLNLALGGLTETQGHWRKVLQPGESVTSFPVSFGVVDGDADAALNALVDYRRKACRKAHPVDDACPVIFNDYMNCLLSNTTTEALLPLIARASSSGCEVFCVDAGWFGTTGGDMEVGDWVENPKRFPGGLIKVIEKIEQAGMIPGLWVEIEAVSLWSELAKTIPDSWVLSLHGTRTVFTDRYLLDFRNPEVRAFADEALDRMIREYRLGYIKIDYNCSPLLGTDRDADSPGDGLLEHIKAVHEWYRALTERHPRVIFENCASGGMRNEYGMLSILHLCSISDQSDYRLMPAIVSGSLATVLPEQLGVWTYPLKDAGPEEAAFNMINAMLARIHQSGKFDVISDEAFALVKEGIELHKNDIRQDIPCSYPVWPLGHRGMEMSKDFQCVGLHIPSRDRLWLAVWRLDCEDGTVSIPLERWFKRDFTVCQAYPAALPCEFAVRDGSLDVTLPARFTARLFQVEGKPQEEEV